MRPAVRFNAPSWWISALALFGLAACDSVHRTDSSEPYRIEQTMGVATLANSATVVLYSIDGRKIPRSFEEGGAGGRLGDKSYANLIKIKNAISPGFHCLLFQSVYNNELIQVPFLVESEKEYQVVKYSVPKGLKLLELYVDLFVAPGFHSAFNSYGFLSIYDMDKVAGVAFAPTGDGTGDYDRRFRMKSEEAAFRDLFESSEITGVLQSGQYHQQFFSNFAETGFQLARKNVGEEDIGACPPVRVMMANGVDDKYLAYLKHPPALSD